MVRAGNWEAGPLGSFPDSGRGVCSGGESRGIGREDSSHSTGLVITGVELGAGALFLVMLCVKLGVSFFPSL